MSWNRRFIAATLSAVALPALASPVELLRCAQELKQIRSTNQDRIELQAGLAIGYGGEHLLLANERGVYVFPARKGALNLIQVEVPDPDPRKLPRRLFLSFTNNQIFGKRLSTIDWDLPPLQNAPSQYIETHRLTRLDGPYEFSKLIREELGDLLSRYHRGQISAAQLLAGNLSLCRSSGRADVSKAITRQVAELELLSSTRGRFGSSRSPASSAP